MKKKNTILLSLFFLLLWVPLGKVASQNYTVFVNHQPVSDDLPTAISRVNNGEFGLNPILLIEPAGNEADIILSGTLTIKKSLTIHGKANGEEKLITLRVGDPGVSTYRLFDIIPDDNISEMNVEFSDIILIGGDISQEDTDEKKDLGGIFYLLNEDGKTTSFTLNNVEMRSSKAFGGGALFTETPWNIYVKRSLISGNAAFEGGAFGIHRHDDNGNKTSLFIGEETKFDSNKADENGGALTVCGLIDVEINNSVFTGNTSGILDNDFNESSEGGGAVYFQTNGDIIIKNNTKFNNNTALVQGGALYIHGSDEARIVDISHVDFIENSCGFHGGAVFSRSVFTVTSCQFQTNTAGFLADYNTVDCECSNGGAIYVESICCGENVEIKFENTEFNNNKASSKGGAVSTFSSGLFVSIDKTNFNGNNARMQGGALHMEDIKGYHINESLFSGNYIKNSTSICCDEMYGGALYAYSGCSDCCDIVKLIQNTRFNGNYILYDNENAEDVRAYGGAVFIDGQAKAQLANNHFKDNYINLKAGAGGVGGGAVATEYASIEILGSADDYSTFTGNKVIASLSESGCCSYTGGGAISNGSGMTISYVYFDSNKVEFATSSTEELQNIGGGAISAKEMGSGETRFELYKNTFSGNGVLIDTPNAAEVLFSGGGAILKGEALLLLEESTFFGNTVELKGNEFTKSGGGAILVGRAQTTADYIVNTTITRNEVIMPSHNLTSGGGGLCVAEYQGVYIMNSILVGNTVSDGTTGKDIYVIAEETAQDDEIGVNVIYSIYESVSRNSILKIGNTLSDIDGAFGNEPQLVDKTIKIIETGTAARKGTLIGKLLPYNDPSCDCTCLSMDCAVYFFLHEGKWYYNEYEYDFDIQTAGDFVKNNTTHYGLINLEAGCSESTEGRVFVVAQNNINRFDFIGGIYNAGAHALRYTPVDPEPDPDVSLQWSVATSSQRSFADVADGTTTRVKEPVPVYLQIRPVVEGELNYDSWTIDYTVIPDSCYYPVPEIISSTSRYDFKNGTAHLTAGTYAYTVSSLTLYQAGNHVATYNFRNSPYTNTIVIDKGDGPEEPEDPWPPVLPEEPEDPDDPDPNPDAWIIVKPTAPLCFTDPYLIVTFDLRFKEKPLEYAVAFTEQSKAAGFEDISIYKDLPKDGVITIPVNNRISKGIYYGYIVLRVKGTRDLEFYPFKVEVVDDVKIVKHPESVSQKCAGDGFTLSVEATGDVLSYQWYFNKEKIIGATEHTYTNVISQSTIGEYYAMVTGYCNVDSSDVATIGLNGFRVLLKWDDVLYVTNLDNRFIKFQWFKNGQAITTYGNSIYYTDPEGLHGSYYLRAYTSETDYIESCPMEFPINTRGTMLSVYPSPVNRGEFITVESDEAGQSYIGALIEMYDMSGRKVYTTIAAAPQIQIPVTVTSGVYMVQIKHQSGRMTTRKIIVK